MNDQSVEQEIKAKGLNAPRVTPERIEQLIVGEYFFTAFDGALGAMSSEGVSVAEVFKLPEPLHLLTFCVLVLQNGFTVTGESACASPQNFDAYLGKRIARDNAKSKIWALEGYALRNALSAA